MRLPPYEAFLDEDAYRRVMDELRERIGVNMPREGVHVSDLTYCLRKGWHLHRLDQTPEGRYHYIGETPDEQVLVWTVGHSHEAIFGKGRMKGQPTERDGIIGTPDFWDDMLEEMKSTRMSAKKTIHEMEHYVAQTAAYAAMFGQQEVRVMVFHLMGDYSRDGPVGAKLHIWRLRFKPEDLEAWWQDMVRRKEVILGDTEPDPDPCWDWECGYCKVRELIGCSGGAQWQQEQAKKKQRQSLDQPAPRAAAPNQPT
jgi:hypothetical protein